MAPHLQAEIRKLEEQGRARIAADAAIVVPFSTRTGSDG
jgi:hypothetical protein